MTKSKRAHLYPAADDDRFHDMVFDVWEGSSIGPACMENGDWGRYHDLIETVVAATWHAEIGTQEWVRGAISLLDFGIDHGRRTHEAIREALR